MVDNDVVATLALVELSLGADLALAGPAATPEWEVGFATMLEGARTHGWVDDEHGAVRGHVERRESTPVVIATGDPA